MYKITEKALCEILNQPGSPKIKWTNMKIGQTTYYKLLKKELITQGPARKVCRYLNWDFDDCFEKQGVS